MKPPKRKVYKTKHAGGMKIKRVETPKKRKVVVKMPSGQKVRVVKKKN